MHRTFCWWLEGVWVEKSSWTKEPTVEKLENLLDLDSNIWLKSFSVKCSCNKQVCWAERASKSQRKDTKEQEELSRFPWLIHKPFQHWEILEEMAKHVECDLKGTGWWSYDHKTESLVCSSRCHEAHSSAQKTRLALWERELWPCAVKFLLHSQYTVTVLHKRKGF